MQIICYKEIFTQPVGHSDPFCSINIYKNAKNRGDDILLC